MFVQTRPRADDHAEANAAALPSQWLSVVSHLDPKYGGLSAAVPELAASLAASNQIGVSVAAFCLADEQYRTAAHPELAISYWPTSRKSWLLNRALRREFRHRVAEVDGLHIHGLWEQSSLMAARAARALGKPYIVSAHGMLEPWALARSRAKKQIYAAAFERSTLAGAGCLHALTRAEARNYREFGCTGPIAVIPNGVDIPAQLSAESFLATYPSVRGKRALLFLGRLHQKKGVELLVRAWARVHAKAADACLVLAGPSEDTTRARAEQLVGDLGLTAQVLFTGMLSTAMKWSALAACECFVLPSYSEGLSIATLEAMGAGVPVILTENCNLPEIVEQRAGWQVRAEEEDLAAALEAWLDHSPSANKTRGQRGAALVRERYSWSGVAKQMAAVYAWVAAGSPRASAPCSLWTEQAQAHA